MSDQSERAAWGGDGTTAWGGEGTTVRGEQGDAKRVLLIDDSSDIREIAAMSLETVAGWEVVAIDKGEIAAETAAAARPDVILLDVMMPGLDGPGTLERLRADPRTDAIPVIFLTAKVQPPEQRRLKNLGAKGLILKPFDPLVLAEQVAEILDAPR